MPITVNDGGVLRTLSTVTTNDGGVIREMDSVVVNDGGVMREIFHANNGAIVEGITPFVVAEDHIVVVESCTGTISAPTGTRIILGSAGQAYSSYSRSGLSGGFVDCLVIDEDVIEQPMSITVSSTKTANSTKVVIGDKVYTCGSVEQIVQSKWGPIGGHGGGRYYITADGKGNYDEPREATGAGGAGYGSRIGGNNGGYGNYGGNSNQKGSSGTAGAGGGGGGGYAAGGGGGYENYAAESDGKIPVQYSGRSGTGIVVFEWD